MSDHAKGNWTFTRGHFISRDLSISSTWYLIRTQEDWTCILIPTGKVVIENKVLGDKTGEGNNRTKSSPVMYVKYPSVRYILPHCSINKCQTSPPLPTVSWNAHCSQLSSFPALACRSGLMAKSYVPNTTWGFIIVLFEKAFHARLTSKHFFNTLLV